MWGREDNSSIIAVYLLLREQVSGFSSLAFVCFCHCFMYDLFLFTFMASASTIQKFELAEKEQIEELERDATTADSLC